MKRVKAWTALLLALLLVLAACGGDEDSGAEGDDTTEATEAAEETTAATEAAEETTAATEATEETMAEIATDIGVTDDAIRIGLNADLSGIFAPLVTQIVDGQEVFWEWVNDSGGIAGRMVEPLVLDNAYDVPTHLENYEVFAGDGDDGVVMFSQSTGSPHTAATAESLLEDDLVAIPLSWYSGWADPAIGENVIEAYTSYCLEAMNAVTYLSENFGTNVAIISFPGEYGQDGAQGAKIAADTLGLTVVYDGEGAVVPGADQTPVITEIVNSGADFVWATINPTTLAEIMGGAVAQGFTGMWSGNSPTYNFQLLGTDLAPALDAYYIHSTYTALWGALDVPGMTEMIDAMRQYRPDAPLSDVYIVSWTEGYITRTILEQAAANGDLTRAGVVAAAKEVTVDMMGLAPNQTWAGEPNDFIVRESYIYDVVAANFTAGATVSDEGGTGFELLEGPYVSPTAADYDFQGACFTPEG